MNVHFIKAAEIIRNGTRAVREEDIIVFPAADYISLLLLVVRNYKW